jgi:hypothetical protein
MSRPYYIYVITIDGQDLCKIGISKSPNSRLSQLQTGSPYRMRFACIFQTPNFTEARKLEFGFHKVMKKHRTNGEWFSLCPIEAIRALTSNIGAYLKIHSDTEPHELLPMMETLGLPGWAVSEWSSEVMQ